MHLLKSAFRALAESNQTFVGDGILAFSQMLYFGLCIRTKRSFCLAAAFLGIVALLAAAGTQRVVYIPLSEATPVLEALADVLPLLPHANGSAGCCHGLTFRGRLVRTRKTGRGFA